jgi:hypothetical protein
VAPAERRFRDVAVFDAPREEVPHSLHHPVGTHLALFGVLSLCGRAVRPQCLDAVEQKHGLRDRIDQLEPVVRIDEIPTEELGPNTNDRSA